MCKIMQWTHSSEVSIQPVCKFATITYYNAFTCKCIAKQHWWNKPEIRKLIK